MILLAIAIVAAPLDTAAVEVSIKDQLVDGESARWRWFPARNDAGKFTYCGFYNAKNRLGGYTGFNPVWVTGTRDGDRFIPSRVEFARGPYPDGLAARKCIEAGFDMRSVPPED